MSLAIFGELEDISHCNEIIGCNNYLDQFSDNKEVTVHKKNKEAKLIDIQERIVVVIEEKNKGQNHGL